jgi:hypothetical protein
MTDHRTLRELHADMKAEMARLAGLKHYEVPAATVYAWSERLREALLAAPAQSPHDCELWAAEGMGCMHCNPISREMQELSRKIQADMAREATADAPPATPQEPEVISKLQPRVFTDEEVRAFRQGLYNEGRESAIDRIMPENDLAFWRGYIDGLEPAAEPPAPPAQVLTPEEQVAQDFPRYLTCHVPAHAHLSAEVIRLQEELKWAENARDAMDYERAKFVDKAHEECRAREAAEAEAQALRDSDPEVCICAAVRHVESGLIVRGHRHPDCFNNLAGRPMKYEGPFEQGFITSRNRFVDRKIGLELQLTAGIASARGGYQKELYSEDLY